MLYPAELQALPQARALTLAQRESLCLDCLLDWSVNSIGQKGIREQQFFALHVLLVTQMCELFRLCTREKVFLLTKGSRKLNERN